MTTEELAPPRDRVLGWAGMLNVRDLGGLRTVDDRRVRWGALVRSDLLCRLADAGRNAPIEHGIRTIVDVRFGREVAADWDRYPYRDWQVEPAFYGLRYLNVPFHVKAAADHKDVATSYDAARTRADLNRLDLDFGQAGVSAIVSTIADAEAGGVLIHCHGGKDRTGMVVAVVLSFLGVPDDAIADDYALSSPNLESLIAEWLDSISRDPVERDRLRMLATPTRATMLDTLAYLRAAHGSAEAYLRAGGLSDAQLERLRERLLD